jgi:hypothetical protein
MAKETADEIFIGTDVERDYHILNDGETAAINIAGFALSWMLKKRLAHPDADAFITKTTAALGGITIAGVYDADPDVNLQRATVVISDTDTDDLGKGDYFWELKRTDSGAETILCYGKMTLLRSVHHA